MGGKIISLFAQKECHGRKLFPKGEESFYFAVCVLMLKNIFWQWKAVFHTPVETKIPVTLCIWMDNYYDETNRHASSISERNF